MAIVEQKWSALPVPFAEKLLPALRLVNVNPLEQPAVDLAI